jgi:hypothetical protein
MAYIKISEARAAARAALPSQKTADRALSEQARAFDSARGRSRIFSTIRG